MNGIIRVPRLHKSKHLHIKILKECFYKFSSKVGFNDIPLPIYGGRHMVTLLPGTGIGPEMTRHVQNVLAAAHVPIDFEVIEGVGQDLVANAITSITRNRVAIKGNLKNIIDNEGFLAPNVMLRTRLDLFVYFIHYKSYKEVNCKYPDLDLVLVRQNTEGEYTMLEHESVEGVVESMKIITRQNTERLANFAFNYARKNGRRKVTAVHKSKQLEVSDGMFLETIKQVAKSFPDIQFEDIYIDRCCNKLVKKPSHFDVLLMPNLYGTVISNIVCGLAGGAGLYSGINYGDRFAVFEPATRQTGEDLIGKNLANPIAMLSAATDLLIHLGKIQHATIIKDAINYTLTNLKIHTFDLGGSNTTSDIISHIIEYLEKNLYKYKNHF